jgi:hypothetical protein
MTMIEIINIFEVHKINKKKNRQGDIMPKGYHYQTYRQKYQIYTLKDRGDTTSVRSRTKT